MKKILLLSVCILTVVIVAGLAACAGATETITQTATKTTTQTQTQTQVVTATFTPPTVGNATITKTVTQTIGNTTQVSVVALTGEPPLIPHSGTINGMYGPCFSCHPVPVGHTGRIAAEDFCNQCHLQGPVSPTLLP